jgi:preprotein translocase subunit SecA
MRLAQVVQVQSRTFEDCDMQAFAQAIAQNKARCRIERGAPENRRVSPAELQALALVAEAVRRTHGFSPHLVQLSGALALLEGRMIEMATGEGKTLTAAMAAVMAAWRGLPCHVVTANDYLAARDAQTGQALFGLCQVSVASVTGETLAAARAAAHAHDIVYTTPKDLLADHLRDGLALGRGAYRTRFALSAARHDGRAAVQGVVMRGIYQVIVDEADSVLIDEAVTPLIISAQHPDPLLERASVQAIELAQRLKEGRDFRLQRALRHVEWTREGRALVEEMTQGMPAFWRRQDRAQELVQMALYAMHLMVRDQHYVVENDKIILVDELTGRLALQRTLSLGMQQVLEASLGIPVSAPTEVSARSSFQRFFRRFDRLGGMTGTAQEARDEFAKVYGLSLVAVPPHRPLHRRVLPLQVFVGEHEKFEAIASECEAILQQGRAVLIGVRSVRTSMALAPVIQSRLGHVDIQILHALEHEREGAIVARAGQAGMVTIATNMAGRGTDIALDPGVRVRGGLHVMVAEVNDFGRIDRQLVGRCARQGDPGSVRYFVSMEDDLFKRFLSKGTLRFWRRTGSLPQALQPLVARAMIWWAQGAAERMAFRQRQSILKQDTEIEKDGF